MARPEFLHLHNHTTYSSRDALQQLPEMCAAAAADRQRAIAITDHGNLAGTWKFAREAAQAGLKPILGEEMYLAHGSRFERDTEASAGDDEISSGGGEGGKRSSYHHLTVLAANPMGWRNLVLLDTLANDAEAYWRKPRVDIDLLAEHNQGLVVLTGCIGGPVAGPLAAGDPDRAQRNLRALVDIFGTDRLRVEVMSHDIPVERRILPRLVELARTHGLRVVATNDAHYTHASEHVAHDAWLCVGSDSTLDDPGRWRFTGNGYHLRTAAEMQAAFHGMPGCEDAVGNSLAVADMIEERVLPEPGRLRLPRYVPEGADPDTVDVDRLLRDQVAVGAKARFGDPLPENVKERLRFELGVVRDKRLSSYFLIVKDMIDHARSHGVRVGAGRGSACGSLISYCLGIVTVDPLAYDLLFERFLAVDRLKMPDIDTDVEQAYAQLVRSYPAQRWGGDNQTVRRTSRWAATLAVLAAVTLGLSACGTNPNSNSKVTITDSVSSNNYTKICSELFPPRTIAKDVLPGKPKSSVVVTTVAAAGPYPFECNYGYKEKNALTQILDITVDDHRDLGGSHDITARKKGASIIATYAQVSMYGKTPSSKLRPLLQHALGRLRFTHGS